MDEQTRKALELARDALNDCDPMTIAGSEARALAAIDAVLAASAAPVARCLYCDDTGDVHTPTGEWRGRCTCVAGAAPAAPRAPLTDEQVAAMFEKAGGGFLSLREASVIYVRGLRDGERAHCIGQEGGAA